jgi:RNA polymerase sigma-70 factor (ECF subfamily)
MISFLRKSSAAPLSLDEESRLVSRAQAGDAEAFSSLYHTYVQPVYRYLLLRVMNSPLAEDLTAEVFVQAADALPRYSQRGLPFGAWLFRIARGRLIDYYRRTARRPVADLNEDLISDLPDPSETAEGVEAARALHEALGQLTDEQRDVIQLRFMEERSLEETAQAMNKTVSAVKALQHRALNTLNRLLGRDGSDDLDEG